MEKTRFPDFQKELRAQRCETCAHFGESVPGRMPTTCRANYPVLMATGQGVAGMFVPVEPEYWCAQWKAKPLS